MGTGGTFALIGAGGYIAPRHMGAIKAVGGDLLVAFDPNDSVGILDRHFPDAHFFTEFERFDRHIDKIRRRGTSIERVAICSPNYLHDAHVRFALRSGSDAICEKPLVLNPWNLDGLEILERETGRRVSTILQLRLHPAILALRDRVARSERRHAVDLTYITSRGRWYHASWKGDEAKSGGIATNIGVHFFDMLGFVFGPLESQTAVLREAERASGVLHYRYADVRWFLSVDRSDLPAHVREKKTTFRAVSIDGEDVEFSDGFTDLHTRSYEAILDGGGYGLSDVRPCIEVVSAFRTMPLTRQDDLHPDAVRHLSGVVS
ncbi:MAG: Gfo/Idh/MocA family oxidoreductase [Janthinobacterium lividum]